MCVSVLWFPPLLFFLPGVVGSQEPEATTKLPGDYFFWFNATTISSKVTRALNTGFTADLKNIFGLQRHCEAFPVQIQLFPAHNPWTSKLIQAVLQDVSVGLEWLQSLPDADCWAEERTAIYPQLWHNTTSLCIVALQCAMPRQTFLLDWESTVPRLLLASRILICFCRRLFSNF